MNWMKKPKHTVAELITQTFAAIMVCQFVHLFLVIVYAEKRNVKDKIIDFSSLQTRGNGV